MHCYVVERNRSRGEAPLGGRQAVLLSPRNSSCTASVWNPLGNLSRGLAPTFTIYQVSKAIALRGEAKVEEAFLNIGFIWSSK